jgi:hypothetical protein
MGTSSAFLARLEGIRGRACESERSARTYTGAADWLQREYAYLRKTFARLLETAVSGLSVVLERCRSRAPRVPECV